MMKFALFLSLLASPVQAATFVTPLATRSTASSSLQSTFTPEDFREPQLSLLDKLNSAKREGAPRIESILQPDYSVTLATAAAGPLISLIFGGEYADCHFGIR